LHHGTLLFSSEIKDLSQALKVDPLKFTDKAVKSVRSRVTNISEHLKYKMDVMDFYEMIINHIINSHPDIKLYELSEYDHQQINILVNNKYSSWDWNFGYSPNYNFKKTIKTNGGFIEINMDVINGIIIDFKLYGDFFNISEISELENIIKSTPHERNIITEKLQNVSIGDYINNTNLDEFIDGLF
jgi:lipoate-protein ligase A